jgi:hypothetical protein
MRKMIRTPKKLGYQKTRFDSFVKIYFSCSFVGITTMGIFATEMVFTLVRLQGFFFISQSPFFPYIICALGDFLLVVLLVSVKNHKCTLVICTFSDFIKSV